jgi:hypothetical protein
VSHENSSNRIDPVVIQTRPFNRESSIESSLSTYSTISSNHDKFVKKKTCCHCLPCCRSQEKPKPIKRVKNSHTYFKLKNRTIYIILSLLFLFFLIVIILLIVLIVVRR